MAEKRIKPYIVPIFVPFAGCPHRCVFCEQEAITSASSRPITGDDVARILDHAIASEGFRRRERREVAFYGGTFTGLPLWQIEELLEASSHYLKQGSFHALRVSTRPDAVDEGRLTLLARSGVRTVELGVQSMHDNVLRMCRRGHTARDTEKALNLLKEKGFAVGVQLMPGLPGDSPKGFRATVDQVLGLAPDMVRLYPTVVIQGTTLAVWYRTGRYRPMSLEEAVDVCVEACLRFESADIAVIRIGLMSSPDLLAGGRILAGPWHPSFGYLVRSGVYHRTIEPHLPRPGECERLRLRVHPQEVSLARGFRNQGMDQILGKTKAKVVDVEGDPAVGRGRIAVDKNGEVQGFSWSQREALSDGGVA